MKEYYTIGEISRLFKISTDTLRFYDKINLLKPWKKGENGYRYYSKAQFELISSILLLRNIGTPIERLEKALYAENASLISSELEIYNADIDSKIEALRMQKLQLEFLKKNIDEVSDVSGPSLEVLPEMYCLLKDYDSRTDELDIKDIESVNHGNQGDWISYANLVSTIDVELLKEGDFHTYKTYGYISDVPCPNAPERLYQTIPAGKYVCGSARVESVEHFEVDSVYSEMLAFISQNGLQIAGDAIERSILNLYRNTPNEMTIFFRLYIPVKYAV